MESPAKMFFLLDLIWISDNQLPVPNFTTIYYENTFTELYGYAISTESYEATKYLPSPWNS